MLEFLIEIDYYDINPIFKARCNPRLWLYKETWKGTRKS